MICSREVGIGEKPRDASKATPALSTMIPYNADTNTFPEY